MHASECKELYWNLNLAIWFLIPSHCQLHCLYIHFIHDPHQRGKSDVGGSWILLQPLLRSWLPSWSSDALITRMRALASWRVFIKVTKESVYFYFEIKVFFLLYRLPTRSNTSSIRIAITVVFIIMYFIFKLMIMKYNSLVSFLTLFQLQI